MDKTEMTELLKKVADGIVSPEEAALKLKMQPFMEIGEFAKVDVHRGVRQGVPEVIYGEGKTKRAYSVHREGDAGKRTEDRARNKDEQGSGGLCRSTAAAGI